MPQALQLLLEGIERRERLVLRSAPATGQAALVGVLERAAIGKQKPQAPLDGLLAGQIVEFLGLLELSPPTITNHLAEHLHDVEAVKDDGGRRQALLHGGDVGQSHGFVNLLIGVDISLK